ncbi:MAG: NAD-dependent deacetylase [Vicinamibacterales bacterium]
MNVDEMGMESAARAVCEAAAILVCAGAGMGVDSGLPDFRGERGFWRAYPVFERLGLSFVDLANPSWFRRDPSLAWGFYGHRLNMYRRTVPHEGFAILRRWVERAPRGGFVFTSNVDGQFQAAGFREDRIFECHGSIHVLQCLDHCGRGLFPADPYEVRVDEETIRAAEPYPWCPGCDGMARPNILMFWDSEWDGSRSEIQESRLEGWLRSISGRIAIIECGAGAALATVRGFSESVAARFGGTLVRINPREPETPFEPGEGCRPRGISLRAGALAALRAIDGMLEER